MWTDLRKYIDKTPAVTGMYQIAIDLYERSPNNDLEWLATVSDDDMDFLEYLSEESACALLPSVEMFDYLEHPTDGNSLNPFVESFLDILFRDHFKAVEFSGRTIDVFDEVFSEAKCIESYYDPVFQPGFSRILEFMQTEMNLNPDDTFADWLAREMYGDTYQDMIKVNEAGHVSDEKGQLYDDSVASYCIIYFDRSCREEDVMSASDILGYTAFSTSDGYVLYGSCFGCYEEDYLLFTDLPDHSEEVADLLSEYPIKRNATSKVRKAAEALFAAPQSSVSHQFITDLLQSRMSYSEVLL